MTTAQAFPAHVEICDGRIFNLEVISSELRDLQWYAKCEGFDLETQCRARFGYGSEWLTLAQYGEIIKAMSLHRAAVISAIPHHWHRCDCGTTERHFDSSCEGKHTKGDIDEECYGCRKGLTTIIRRGSDL